MTKTALVTGASSGIGYEFTQLLAQDQYNLVLVARSTDKLEQLQQELTQQYDIEVYSITQDLATDAAAEKVHEITKRKNLTIDVLVNNAGIGDFGFFHQSNWGKQQKMIQLNITTLTHLTHCYLPAMVEQGNGKILNVASTASFQPGPLMSVYYATKAYVLSFTEALNNEVKDKGVTATALCPGPTETSFQDEAEMEESQLFENLSVMKASKVAQAGYNGMQKGKAVVVPGLVNKLMVTSVRFTPRKLVTSMVRKVQEPSS